MGVRLLTGDARDLLPTLAPDVIVTDPVWPNCPADLLQGADDPDGLWRETMAVLPDSAKRMVVILRGDSDPRFLRHVPERLAFFRAIHLDYAMPGYIGRKLGGAELAYWFGPPVVYQPGRKVIPGRAPIAQPGDRPPNGHPCSRSQIHMDWLVWWASDEGETICDPFMGSGSTAVACVRHARDFIGIEIEPEYVRLTERRLRTTTPQLPGLARAPESLPSPEGAE
jgi:hypothetical protein